MRSFGQPASGKIDPESFQKVDQSGFHNSEVIIKSKWQTLYVIIDFESGHFYKHKCRHNCHLVWQFFGSRSNQTLTDISFSINQLVQKHVLLVFHN